MLFQSGKWRQKRFVTLWYASEDVKKNIMHNTAVVLLCCWFLSTVHSWNNSVSNTSGIGIPPYYVTLDTLHFCTPIANPQVFQPFHTINIVWIVRTHNTWNCHSTENALRAIGVVLEHSSCRPTVVSFSFLKMSWNDWLRNDVDWVVFCRLQNLFINSTLTGMNCYNLA